MAAASSGKPSCTELRLRLIGSGIVLPAARTPRRSLTTVCRPNPGDSALRMLAPEMAQRDWYVTGNTRLQPSAILGVAWMPEVDIGPALLRPRRPTADTRTDRPASPRRRRDQPVPGTADLLPLLRKCPGLAGVQVVTRRRLAITFNYPGTRPPSSSQLPATLSAVTTARRRWAVPHSVRPVMPMSRHRYSTTGWQGFDAVRLSPRATAVPARGRVRRVPAPGLRHPAARKKKRRTSTAADSR